MKKILFSLFCCLFLITYGHAQPETVINGPAENSIVSSLQFSPDGKLLAAGINVVRNGNLSPVEIRVWEIETGRLLWERASDANWVTTLIFSPNSELIIFTGLRIKDQVRLGSRALVWNARDGESLNSPELDERKSLWALTFTPDGAKVMGVVSTEGATPGNASLKQWDAESGKELWSQETDYNLATSIAFSTDGQFLFVQGIKQENDSWPTSRCVFYSYPEYHIVNTIRLGRMGAERSLLLPDGETVVVSGIVIGEQNQAPDGRGLAEYEIGFWERTTGKQKMVLIPETMQVHLDTLASSPDGKQIVGSCMIRTPKRRGAIHIWDAQSGDLQQSLDIELKDEKVPLSFFWIALAPDGKSIAVPVAADKIELRDLKDGKLIRAFE